MRGAGKIEILAENNVAVAVALFCPAKFCPVSEFLKLPPTGRDGNGENSEGKPHSD